MSGYLGGAIYRVPLGGHISSGLAGATYRCLSGDTFLTAWPVQPMASMRECVACEAAPGYRSGDHSTVHAAAIDLHKIKLQLAALPKGYL